jgi:8-oxo-dGTP diphosphatase
MKTAEGELLKDDASNYDRDKYEKPAVTVDIAICSVIDDEIKVLLIKRRYPPFRDYWALPGGFVDINKKETLEQAAIRELEEETGITNSNVGQLKAYGDPDRDPRMRIITIAFYALIPYNEITSNKKETYDDAKEKKWFSLRNPPNMAFDHANILKDLLSNIMIY